MVAAVGTMMGAEARVMDNTDDKGFQEAENWQADIVIYSDDVDFVAQDAQSKHVIHNNPATSRIFVAALEFLNEKSLKGETVLILGLGPIGFWAVERLMELGARPLCYDIDLKKLFRMSKMLPGADLIYNQKSLEGNISRFSKPIIFEAVPEKIILADNRMEELLQDTNPIVSAPGVPLSWPQSWLYSGDKGRLFHEPLMAGTASMLAGLFVEDYLPRFSFSYSFFFSSE
jgi:D-arabinose 1-dehydrogenase-like Zn-dependent alcohol dehydrogenase